MSYAKKRNRRKGTAIVEAAFMIPWLAFLFVGILDFGYFAYAAICTQNAARAAAMAMAAGTGTVSACTAALGELRGLPNMGTGGVPITTCATNPAGATAGLPVGVCTGTLSTAAPVWSNAGCNSSTTLTCADCAQDASSTSIIASVTYQSLPMVPIPGIMMGTMAMTRTAEIRVVSK